MEDTRPLDVRKQTVLRAIVEHYVRSGEPVGSKAVADEADLNVSAATIRNEMGSLEREGYIAQPHTSAGRVPTDKGYRYYVDILAPKTLLADARRDEIERALAGTLRALDDLLERASMLLAELTDYTALASLPPFTDAIVRAIDLIPLGGGRVLVIIVGDGAQHEEVLVQVGSDHSRDEIRAVSDLASRLVEGKRLEDAADELDAAPSSGEVVSAVAVALRHLARKGGRVFAQGTSNMVAWEPAPAVQRVLEAIEAGTIGPLLAVPSPEHIAVQIGSEIPLSDLQDLSLIAAGYALGRWGSGTLGVLGPTRMDYPTIMSTVGAVARGLSRALRRLEST